MSQPSLVDPRLADPDVIRPYVFIRNENRIVSPGQSPIGWFKNAPILKDALSAGEGLFSDQLIRLENRVFGAELAMPRWVLYDCALLPGMVAGFAIHRAHASQSILDICKPDPNMEWIPISLFIIIPTLRSGEWVAHNLSSVNSCLPVEERFYGLGFMSKAFGLWYANVETCCGMTQWTSPAIKLHSHYGDMEVLTAFTPSHTYSETVTYRVRVQPEQWIHFFTDQQHPEFSRRFKKTGLIVDRLDPSSIRALQDRIEAGEGPFFLDANEINTRSLDSQLTLFSPS